MNTQRLTPQRWIAAGFQSLQSTGPRALAAEPLARHIGATKGSFYWHFKDVPAFHEALLRHWQTEKLAGLMELLCDDGPADRNLRHFGRQILADPIEPALRVWAHNSPQVAATLTEVDAERQKYLVHLLNRLGLRNPDFARALLACLIGLPQLHQGDARQAAFEALVDTVLALT